MPFDTLEKLGDSYATKNYLSITSASFFQILRYTRVFIYFSEMLFVNAKLIYHINFLAENELIKVKLFVLIIFARIF